MSKSIAHHIGGPVRRIAGGLAVAALVAASASPAAAAPLWKLDVDHPIVFQRLTSLGTLLVSTGQSLLCVNPKTGEILWRRDDLMGVAESDLERVSNSPIGMIELQHGSQITIKSLEVLDLETGRHKWDSMHLPIAGSLGAMAIPSRHMFVVVGTPKHGAGAVVLGVDEASGTVRWQQDGLFKRPLQLFPARGSSKARRRLTIDGSAPVVFDGSDAMIVYWSADGPMRINLATGAREWVATGLKGKEPPALFKGYAPMTMIGGTLYVPCGKALMALDAKSGAALWKKPREFRGRLAQLASTDAGLVARGAATLNERGGIDGLPFLDLLDPATGDSRWKKPFPDIMNVSSFVVSDGHIRIAADGALLDADLATGTRRTLCTVKFKGGEQPTSLEILGDNTLLASRQNLMLIDAKGAVQYHDYYPAPVAPDWVRMNATATATLNDDSIDGAGSEGEAPRHPALVQRLQALRGAAAYTAVLTQTDPEAHNAAEVVKLDKSTGKDAVRVRIGNPLTPYEVDPVEGRLFFKRSEREIVCYSF